MDDVIKRINQAVDKLEKVIRKKEKESVVDLNLDLRNVEITGQFIELNFKIDPALAFLLALVIKEGLYTKCVKLTDKTKSIFQKMAELAAISKLKD